MKLEDVKLGDFLKEFVKENKLGAVRDRVNELLKKDLCPDCLICGKRKDCGEWREVWNLRDFQCKNTDCPAHEDNSEYISSTGCFLDEMIGEFEDSHRGCGNRRKFVVNCPQYKRGER